MKYRIQFLIPWVNPFHVPMYISRVECEDNTQGWQVRYYLAPAKFFSDSKKIKGKRTLRTPYVSLEEAKQYLLKYYQGPKPCIKYPPVRLVWKKKKNKNIHEAYLVVSHPQRGRSELRIYIGTENTFTLDKLAKAEKILADRQKKMYAKFLTQLKTKYD